MHEEKFITKFGLMASLVLTTFYSLNPFPPKKDFLSMGNEQWISFTISFLIMIPLIKIYYKIITDNDYMIFEDVLLKYFGNILSKIILFLYGIRFIFATGLELRDVCDAIKVFLLTKTPFEVVILLLLFSGVYLVRGGIKNIVRTQEMFFFIGVIGLLFGILFYLNACDFSNLLPVFQQRPSSYILSPLNDTREFLGIEIVFFILPLLKDKKKGKREFKIIFNGLLIVYLLRMLIFVVSISVFGIDQLQRLYWPIISSSESVSMEGVFIERLEGLLIIIYSLMFFARFGAYFYAGARCIDSVFNIKEIKVTSLIVVPFIFVISMIPKSVAEVYKLITYKNISCQIFSLLIIPLILLFFTYRSKRIKGGSQ